MNQISTAIQNLSIKKTTRKLCLFVFVAALVVVIHAHWNAVMVQVVEIQRHFHSSFATHINAVAEDTTTYGWSLIALSFVYGVFHAVGPGHGKAIIATYLGTHRETIAKGIGISMSSALLQSVVAIGMVSILAKVLSLTFADIENYGEDLALVSYVLLMLLGLVLSVSAIRRFVKLKRSAKMVQPMVHVHHEGHQSGRHDLDHHSHEHQKHDHDHDSVHATSSCGCKHAHVPDADQSALQLLAVVLSIGIRPCSGAILVLIYAHLVGVFHYGIAATLSMGLGTGIGVSAIALASQYARGWLESMLSASGGEGHGVLHPTIVSISLRLAGGALLMAMGWGLYQSAMQTSLGHPLL